MREKVKNKAALALPTTDDFMGCSIPLIFCCHTPRKIANPQQNDEKKARRWRCVRLLIIWLVWINCVYIIIMQVNFVLKQWSLLIVKVFVIHVRKIKGALEWRKRIKIRFYRIVMKKGLIQRWMGLQSVIVILCYLIPLRKQRHGNKVEVMEIANPQQNNEDTKNLQWT